MKVSLNWLQEYLEAPLPSKDELVKGLTMHAFEIEGSEVHGLDTVIDVKVLPDKAHYCLSHRGIAREISAIFKLPLKSRDEYFDMPTTGEFEVEIKNELSCRRYCGALIKGVAVGPSPEWLKLRLEAVGQRSINNIVDATNYVMLSIGQPLHAFDADKLAKGSAREAVGSPEKIGILVEEAGEISSITALDGKEYKIGPETLLIKDLHSKQALGIAGIKGGMHAAIDASTKNILLEAANFDPVLIRKTARKIGLATDASKRFENEITPEFAFEGLSDVIELIVQLAGGEVEGFVDVYHKKQPTYKVGVSLHEINHKLGTSLKEKDVEPIFDRLNFFYEKVSPRERIVSLAKELEGRPYKYGASVLRDGPDAFDCSSFVSYLCVQVGIAIPRMAVDQYVWGDPIEASDLKPGDAVYPNTGEMKRKIDTESVEFMKGTPVPEGVDHVGLYLGDGKIIHATSKVGKVVIEELKSAEAFQNISGYRRLVRDTHDRYVISVPSERLDIRIKEDLVEEVGRIYGYEHIHAKTPQNVKHQMFNKSFFHISKIRNILCEAGFSEVYTYSFVEKAEVEVANPLASDKGFLRSELTPAISKSLEFNLRNADLLGLSQIKIFEIGRVFKGGKEYNSLSIGIAHTKDFKAPPTAEGDPYTINEAIRQTREMLIEKLGANVKTLCTVDDTGGIMLVKSKPIGMINNVDGILEINVDMLIASLPDPEGDLSDIGCPTPGVGQGGVVKFKQISQYPVMLRDIAVFVPGEKGREEEVLSIIKMLAGNLLVKTSLFDVFTKISKTDPSDIKTSYAFQLVFQ